jgi:hypothetical protein
VSDGGGNTNGLNLSAGPGFAYFITPNIGLEALLKYNGLAGFGSQAYHALLRRRPGLKYYLKRFKEGNAGMTVLLLKSVI